MSKENTFKIYAQNEYYNELFKKLSNFIERNKGYVRDLIKDNVRVSNTELSDFTIEAIYISDRDNDKIDLDIVCKCDVEYSYTFYQGKHSDHDIGYLNNAWLVVHASAFISNLKNVKFYGIEPYEKSKMNKPLNGDMVPIIKASEYEKYAQDIIKKYYGKNYDFSKPINIEELAKKMGLNIITLKNNFCFEKDKAIFAQIYFEDTLSEFYSKTNDKIVKCEVKANTIIIDNSIQSAYSYGSKDVTIAHECVHFALHKKAFQFSKFINKSEIKCITCYNDGKIKGVIETDNNESFMEAQANGIAPYLVMPTEALRDKADSLFKAYSMELKQLEFMDRFIRDLKNEFNATIILTKKRLKEIGYLQNIGVFEWDKEQGKYIDSYQYKKDSLANNETFSITFEDYSKMVSNPSNTLFKKCLADDYIYVQNHVVYNDKKYVIRDDDGECYLTEYAKYHMDECALKFVVKSKNKYFSKNNLGTFCYLCKGIADDMSFDLKLSDESFISNAPNLSELIEKHREAEKNVFRKVEDSDTLGECLKEISKLYDVVPKELIDNGINHVTYSRYLNDKVKKIDIRKAICICHAFNFTLRISNLFINKFSNKGLTEDREGDAFRKILTSMRGNSMESINEFLTKLGIEPLC